MHQLQQQMAAYSAPPPPHPMMDQHPPQQHPYHGQKQPSSALSIVYHQFSLEEGLGLLKVMYRPVMKGDQWLTKLLHSFNVDSEKVIKVFCLVYKSPKASMVDCTTLCRLSACLSLLQRYTYVAHCVVLHMCTL